MKLRPVLVLTDPIGTVPELLVAYISSVMPAVQLPSDVVLDPLHPEHASSGLKTKSVLRLHKLATIHQRSLVRRLGTVGSRVSTRVAMELRTLLRL